MIPITVPYCLLFGFFSKFQSLNLFSYFDTRILQDINPYLRFSNNFKKRFEIIICVV